MNYIDVIDSEYFKKTYSEIEKLKKDFPVNHGFIHINNVIENAKKLAITFKLTDREKDLLLIAAALHDIGYINGRDDHACNGGILVKEILKEWNFNDDDIKIVSKAISSHGGKNESDYVDLVSMCLIIADKLDFINTRYDKTRLKDDYLKIFPHIISTYLDYDKNEIILNIMVNKEFSIELFNDSSYYNKLNGFLNLLSRRLQSSYTIRYVDNHSSVLTNN